MFVFAISAVLLGHACFHIAPVSASVIHTGYIDEFDQKLNATDKKVVVLDFWGAECDDCKKTHDKLEESSAKYSGTEFIEVDVDKDPEAIQRYNITAIPTVVVLKNNEKVDSLASNDTAQVEELIKKHAA